MVRSVDSVVDDRRQADPPQFVPLFRKTGAAAVTLGTGGSLGPEAPSAELGALVAFLISSVATEVERERLLLLASGAASGVAAAFDAPVAGALFAVEFVLQSSFDRLSLGAIFISSALSAFLTSEIRTAIPGGLMCLVDCADGVGAERTFPVHPIHAGTCDTDTMC